MFRFFRASMCQAGVITTFHQVGAKKAIAREMCDSNPEYFTVVSDMLKHLGSQHRNIVAAVAYNRHLILLSRTIPDADPDIVELLYLIKEGVWEGLRYQLKISPKRIEIMTALYTVLHLMEQEEMPTQAQIAEMCDPANL